MQNINIVYKVDRSDVERSNQSVQQARDLTDRLKNSAKQLGDQGTKSNKQFQGTIEAVRVKMAQLRTQIENTNRSDTKRMNDLIKQYHQAQKEVDTFNKKLKEQSAAASNASGGINKAASAFNNMYQAIRLVVGAAVVRELVNTTLEAATLAGQVETVGNAFRKQIPQAESTLYNLRKATRNTIGDLELMQKALSFQNLGGNVEALPMLLEFAAVRAQQTGQSVDYLVNSIVNGIGRKSVLVLDNLGISATRLKEELGGVSTQAASVADVSAAVGRIAEQELRKMGGFAENAATSVEQLKVAWQELRIESSKSITKTFGVSVSEWLKGATEGFKALFEAYNKNISTSEVFAEKQRKEAAQVELNNFNQRIHNKTKEEGLIILDKEIERLTSVLGRYATVRDAHQKVIDSYREMWLAREGNQYKIEEEIEAQQKIIKVKEADALLDQEILRLLIAKRDAMQKQNAEQKVEIESLDVLRKRLAELQRIREEEVSIHDKASLDRYQREINLLEDRIAKISDNIAWEVKWNEQGRISRKAQDEFNESLKDTSKALDELNKKYAPQNFKLDKFDFGNIEVDAEVKPTFRLDNEEWVRFRIGMKKAFAEAQTEMINTGIDDTAFAMKSIIDIELMGYQNRLDNLRSFYAEQQLLAGDNENYKKELRLKEQRDSLKIQKEMAVKQKQARIAGIIIDTAAAIAKTAATMGFPAAIPFIAIAGATGAIQLAIAQKTPAGFKDGVIDLKGPGTATSDSIPARLSRGESVMTAKETKSSINTLRMIRAKQLDDKTIARLAMRAKGGESTIFDDTRLAGILERVAKNTASNDFVRKGSALYEVKSDNDSYKRYVRQKLFGS